MKVRGEFLPLSTVTRYVVNDEEKVGSCYFENITLLVEFKFWNGK